MKKTLLSLWLLLAGSLAVLALASCGQDDDDDDAPAAAPSAFVVWEPITDGTSGEKAVAYNIGMVQNGAVTSWRSTDSAAPYYTWGDLTEDKAYTFRIYARFANGKTSFKTHTIDRTVTAHTGGRCLRVMGYFLDSNHAVDEQNLHLAVTTDGLHWQALNGNGAVFAISTIGGNRVRDPYIVKKPDGTYLMIATDWTTYEADTSALGNHRLYDGTTSDIASWNYTTTSYWDVNTSCLIFADSADLCEWTNERQIQMVSDEDKLAFYAKNSNYQFCWAPEIIHNGGEVIFSDPATGDGYRYGVIWSGQGETNGVTSRAYNPKTRKYELTRGHGTGYRRTFVNYTNDFETFTAPQVYFDPGNSNIDASVCAGSGGRYYIFYKDEKSGYYGMAENYSSSLLPNSFNQNYVYSRAYNGKQVQEVAGGTFNQGEGMFCFQPYAGVSRWICVLDAHDANVIGYVFATFQTDDFVEWSENNDTSWPSGAIRHGASVEVTLEEMVKLIDTFGF